MNISVLNMVCTNSNLSIGQAEMQLHKRLYNVKAMFNQESGFSESTALSKRHGVHLEASTVSLGQSCTCIHSVFVSDEFVIPGEASKVYAHQMVRTDSKTQKLDAFLHPSRPSQDPGDSMDTSAGASPSIAKHTDSPDVIEIDTPKSNSCR